MTRIPRGLCLIGLTALFASACGDSGKKVKIDTCDGSACSDAKRDTTPSSDPVQKQDVADASSDRTTPDLPREPVAQPDEAPTTDERPTSDTPPDLQPDTIVPPADGRDTQDDVPLPTVVFVNMTSPVPVFTVNPLHAG